MRAATEGHLRPVIPQGNLVEVLGREVRKGSPGEVMVESSPSRQRRPPCKTSKEMSDEAADAAALTYLLTLTSFTVYTAALHALILIHFYLLISGLGYPGLVVFQQIKHFRHQKQAAGNPTPAASNRRGTTNTQC